MCFWDVFVGVCCGCNFLLVCYDRLSLCGNARRQSRAMHVTCTKCMQVSLSETCKFLHPSCMKTFAFLRGGSLLPPLVDRLVPVDGIGSDGACGLEVEE